MCQLFKDDSFMSRIVKMNANFFLQISEFCIEKLENHFTKVVNNQQQLEDQEIFRQIETIQDPELLKLFEESGSEGEESEKQLQSNEQKVEKIKKSKTKQKPYFMMFKPKAPTTSYLHFLHDNKVQIAARYNLTNISEVTKVASQQWKKLSDAQKQKYCKKSEEQKAKYREAMTVYKDKYAKQIKQEKRRRQSGYKLKKKNNKNTNKQKKSDEKIEDNKSEQKKSENKSSESQQQDVQSTDMRRYQKQNQMIIIDRSEQHSNEDLSLDFTSV